MKYIINKTNETILNCIDAVAKGNNLLFLKTKNNTNKAIPTMWSTKANLECSL